MQTLRRIAAVLIFPALAYLGAACERTDTPTEATLPPAAFQLSSVDDRWVNYVDPSPLNGYSPPGTSCTDPGYPTIQDAVNAAGSGDVIHVCPGPYNESVTISFSLTLLGPNAGTSWSGARGPEAIVTSPATTFNLLNGQDVTINGFTINGDFGIYVSGATSGTVIQDNITTGGTRALTLDAPGSGASVLSNDLISNVRSLHVSGGPYTNMKINGNRFSGPLAGTGIFFSGALANSITGFEFKTNQVLHLANIASNISGGTVSGNTFNVASPGSLNLQIDLHNSIVTANTFNGSDVTACLQLFGSQFGEIPSDHVTVTGNTFSRCNVYGIQLSPDIHHIYISNNAISNNVDGVNTRDFTFWNVTGLEIHINNNNITGNTGFGVRNGQMGVLDATCNWWGDASGPGPVGPGSGDKVSMNVDYTPWLTTPAPTGVCAGGVPSGKVTGGGQINLSGGGVGSFGFNAKSDAGMGSGHLDYLNHTSGAHLDCEVKFVTQLTTTMAKFQGTCTPKGTATATSFMAEVEDGGNPGKNNDKFKITYGINTDGSNVTTIRSGNIEIHK